MARLVWGEGPRLFDQGIDRGVLYLDGLGVPWNGLVSLDEKETGGVDVDHYFEGTRLYASQEIGDFEAAITAYTYPDVFAEYNGYSERNIYQRFGLAYRTQYGEGTKLHIVYNVLVSDGARSWKTIGAAPDPSLFVWDISASAVPIPGAKPASRLSMEVEPNSEVLSSIEDILYGTATTEPRLPDPAELYELYESATRLRIIYHGDGTYTASGPDDMVRILDNGRFELNAPSVFLKDQDIFQVSSY